MSLVIEEWQRTNLSEGSFNSDSPSNRHPATAHTTILDTIFDAKMDNFPHTVPPCWTPIDPRGAGSPSDATGT